MSNLLNFALGGLTGALSGSPLQSILGSPLQALTGSSGTALTKAATGGLAGLLSRDNQVADLGSIRSDVNLLQQAAGALGSSSAAAGSDASALLNLPPLPPMPAPAKPATVPTDDHGQSNIVFSDSRADGALIQ